MDYKKMYLKLFDTTAQAIDLLVEAHQEAERLYIKHDDTPIEVKRPEGPSAAPVDKCGL